MKIEPPYVDCYMGYEDLGLQIACTCSHNRERHIKRGFIEVHDDFHRIELRLVNDVERDVGRFEILRCILSGGPLVRPGVKKTGPGIAEQYFHSAMQEL